MSMTAKSLITLCLYGKTKREGLVLSSGGIFKNNAELFWINYDRIGLGWYTPGDNSLFFCRDLESTDDLGDLGDISTFFSPSSQKEEVWVGAKFAPKIYVFLTRGG